MRSRRRGVPLRRVREKALAPVGRVRAVVVDAALAIDFLVSSTEAAQHVAAAKHRLLANRPPTTPFGFCSAGFCALIGESFSCAAFPKAFGQKVGQRASQGDADAEGDGSLHRAAAARFYPNMCTITLDGVAFNRWSARASTCGRHASLLRNQLRREAWTACARRLAPQPKCPCSSSP